jgi:hypothetical protein
MTVKRLEAMVRQTLLVLHFNISTITLRSLLVSQFMSTLPLSVPLDVRHSTFSPRQPLAKMYYISLISP